VDGSCFTARGQSTLPRDPAYFLRTICAVHESGSGTSRHFSAAQQFGRIWSEADINHRAGFMMGWTPPDGIGVPKVEVLSTT
jgi:hypothetical protein